MKSSKLRLNKEVNDLKASKVTAAASQDSATKNAAMAIDELEKSQFPTQTTLSSASTISTTNGKNKVTEDVASGSAIHSLRLTSHIMQTLGQTFPLMF